MAVSPHTIPTVHGNGHLTQEEVLEIRHLYTQGVRQRDLAFRFGVEQPAISKIIRGDHYQLAPGPTEPSRHCIDCSAEIASSKKRCDPCRRERLRLQSRKYYREHGRNGHTRKPKNRYSVMSENEGREAYVINRMDMLKYGPYPYNHARYLASKWNGSDPFTQE